MNGVVTKDVVLVGGGHAHAYTVKMLPMMAPKGVRITLISRDVETPYSGMLPGHVAGLYSRDECHVDLARLCSFSNVCMVHAEVCRIDRKKKLLYMSDGRPPLHYDVLSLDIGISPKPVPGVDMTCEELRVTPVKPIDRFSRRWDEIRTRASTWAHGAASGDTFKVVVVGGGAGGVELCLAMHDRLKTCMGTTQGRLVFSLLQRGAGVMPSHNAGVRERMLAALTERNIHVHCHTDVAMASISTADTSTGTGTGRLTRLLQCVDGERSFEYDEAVWCTHACGQSWLADTGLATTSEGCARVHDTLESINTPGVFACGDICDIEGHARPKAGVFAVRAGPPVTRNIVHFLLGEPLERWTPQEQFLGIIRVGDNCAVASRGPLAIQGEYLWALKDHIDRKWMAMYTITDAQEKSMAMDVDGDGDGRVGSPANLPGSHGEQVADLLAKAAMRCGGCGSKVGSTALKRVLKKLSRWARRRGHASLRDRPDICAGIGDDAAVTVPPNPTTHRLVQTVDFFRSFIPDPYLFGQVTAQHALSDCFAMNAQPLTALAMCTVPFGTEAMTEETLLHLLAGASLVLERAGCVLVGGHTCEAAEVSLGFSITGSAAISDVLPKGPALPGASIILTKALGTGALLAADMRGRAKGRWVHAAVNTMLLDNQEAAKVAKRFGCTACTDVTGFGLMGHLVEMLQYTGSGEAGAPGDRTTAIQSNEASDRNGEWSDDDDDDAENGAACGICTASAGHVARLNMGAMPLLAGAEHVVSSGVVSSLQPDNLRSARAVRDSAACKARFGAVYQLLFDPQTAGGLLCAVPTASASACVAALHAAGYADASDIGIVDVARPDDLNYIVNLV